MTKGPLTFPPKVVGLLLQTAEITSRFWADSLQFLYGAQGATDPHCFMSSCYLFLSVMMTVTLSWTKSAAGVLYS